MSRDAFVYDLDNWRFWEATILSEDTEVTHNTYSESKPLRVYDFGCGNVKMESPKIRTKVYRTQHVWLRFTDGTEEKISLDNPIAVRNGQHAIIAGIRSRKDMSYYYTYIYVKETGELSIIDEDNVKSDLPLGGSCLLLLLTWAAIVIAAILIFSPPKELYVLVFILCFLLAFCPLPVVCGMVFGGSARKRLAKVRALVLEHIRNDCL